MDGCGWDSNPRSPDNMARGCERGWKRPLAQRMGRLSAKHLHCVQKYVRIGTFRYFYLLCAKLQKAVKSVASKKFILKRCRCTDSGPRLSIC